jgi:hypothetical protein
METESNKGRVLQLDHGNFEGGRPDVLEEIKIPDVFDFDGIVQGSNRREIIENTGE